MSITVSPYAFTGLVHSSGNVPQPTTGWGIIPFALLTFSLSAASFIALLVRTKKAIGNEKRQLRFVTYGIFMMLGLIITTIMLPAIFLKNTFFVPFAPIYVLGFLGMTTYTIIRHKLFDIRLIIARSLAYSLLVISIGIFYSAGIFLISTFLLRIQLNPEQIAVYIVMAIFAAFTFQPLKNFLKVVTDKIFYKGNYSSNEIVFKLTKIMASTLHFEDLTKGTLHELLNTMRITRGAFIILGKNDMCRVSEESFSTDIHFYSVAIKKLLSLNRVVNFDEEQDNEIREIMTQLNITVAVPLLQDDKIKGLLVLGEKKSGEIYSQKDIEVLEIFGPEVSVALHNVEAYEAISKFNITLKNEIDKATKELQEANVHLKELDVLKNEFVSVASHELRTPMTAIKSYLWMALEGKGGKLTEKQKYYIDRAYTSVDRLIKMVNDMLNISRIESGRLTITMKSVAIDKLVQEVIDDVQPRAEELGVSVKLNLSSPPPAVLADNDKIKEVVFNLIGNSLKFTPKGGKITVAFEQENGMVIVKVTDTGSGLEADDLPKLFQKFGLLPGSYVTNQAALGTGLGLYICKSIIELHEGKISASSEGRGKGAEFKFTLKVFNESDLQRLSSKFAHQETNAVDLIHSQV